MLIEYVLNKKRKVVNEAVGRALIKVKAAKQVTEDTIVNRSMADKPKVQKAPEVLPELDSAGEAWNPDIHAASKIQNNDGTWRKKPGARTTITESDE